MGLNEEFSTTLYTSLPLITDRYLLSYSSIRLLFSSSNIAILILYTTSYSPLIALMRRHAKTIPRSWINAIPRATPPTTTRFSFRKSSTTSLQPLSPRRSFLQSLSTWQDLTPLRLGLVHPVVVFL